jgi:hypothetical protein
VKIDRVSQKRVSENSQRIVGKGKEKRVKDREKRE